MFAIWFFIALGGSFLIASVFSEAWRSDYARALTILHMMPILLATLFVQGPILKQPILKPLGITFSFNRWWLLSWLSPVLALAFGVIAMWFVFGIDPVFDVETYLELKRSALPPEHHEAFDQAAHNHPPKTPLWFWLVVQGLPAGLTINLLVSLMIEIGFRGFLFREIQGGFWRRSLLIGVIEAIWFLPTVAYGLYFPAHQKIGMIAIVVFCLSLSPVLVYLRVRSDSLLPVAAARGTLLALTITATELSFHAQDWQRPFYGIAGSIGLLGLLFIFWVHDRFFASKRLMKLPPLNLIRQNFYRKRFQ